MIVKRLVQRICRSTVSSKKCLPEVGLRLLRRISRGSRASQGPRGSWGGGRAGTPGPQPWLAACGHRRHGPAGAPRPGPPLPTADLSHTHPPSRHSWVCFQGLGSRAGRLGKQGPWQPLWGVRQGPQGSQVRTRGHKPGQLSACLIWLGSWGIGTMGKFGLCPPEVSSQPHLSTPLGAGGVTALGLGLLIHKKAPLIPRAEF